MASGSFTVDEVVGLLDDDSDLAELEGLDLDNDSDSDDGDREEAEFTSISGTEELVSTSLLRATATQEEEPAFQDSLLLLDNDLETPTSVDNFTETDSNYSESDSSSVASSDQASDSEVTYHSRGRGGRGRAGRRRGRGSRGRGTSSVKGRSRASRGRGRSRGRSRGRGGVRGGGTRGRTGNGRDNLPPVEWKWNTTYNDDSSMSSPPDFDANHGPSDRAQAPSTPVGFFQLLFTEDLVDLIVQHTNRYALQKGFHFTVSREDILAYIGINIAMGIKDLPEITDYWAQEPIIRSPWFLSVMSLKRFQAISRFIHFADNATALPRNNPTYDKLWKIRSVIESVNRQAQASYTPGKSISIDESMIGTRGRLSFLQYMPKKPTKWGIKVWVSSESKTGYIYNFHVYTGKGVESQHGLAYAVVMDLLDTSYSILEEGRVLYVDNFYTSPVLFEDLYHRGTFASGTVRANRKHYPSDDLDKNVQQKGDMCFRYHGFMTAGK